MLRQRLISALVVIPLVIGAIWYGGIIFYAVVLLVSCLALREVYVLGGMSTRPLITLGIVANIFLLTIAYVTAVEQLFVGLLLFFIIINIYCVLSFPMDLKELMILLWGKIYITSFFAFFLWLRALDNGFMLLLSVFLTIWASDTGAYLCGITLGRNKLMPAVSPKKSVEGALGGLLFAAIIMLMMAPYLTLHRFTAVFVGLGLSILGQCGDLAESALKRWGNSKDSGIFLPGHGGVLDRLDSLLFAVPVAYYLFLFLIPGRGL